MKRLPKMRKNDTYTHAAVMAVGPPAVREQYRRAVRAFKAKRTRLRNQTIRCVPEVSP